MTDEKPANSEDGRQLPASPAKTRIKPIKKGSIPFGATGPLSPTATQPSGASPGESTPPSGDSDTTGTQDSSD